METATCWPGIVPGMGSTYRPRGRSSGSWPQRVSYPIPDVSVTTPEHEDQVVADIERDVAAGGKVFVYCWGGLGRTGTVVGCWHVSHGPKPAEVLARIAAARKGTRKAGRPGPETPEQVEMLHEMEIRRLQSRLRQAVC